MKSKNNMKYITNFLIIFYITLFSYAQSKENFFDTAKNLFENKKYEESKFLFQRNIVFNPKHSKSYLYLAKIYNSEENINEELKYIKTTLLLDPGNEEALYMLINIELDKSNFSEVKNLTKDFLIICVNLCKETKKIEEKLKNIQAKDESKQ